MWIFCNKFISDTFIQCSHTNKQNVPFHINNHVTRSFKTKRVKTDYVHLCVEINIYFETILIFILRNNIDIYMRITIIRMWDKFWTNDVVLYSLSNRCFAWIIKTIKLLFLNDKIRKMVKSIVESEPNKGMIVYLDEKYTTSIRCHCLIW